MMLLEAINRLEEEREILIDQLMKQEGYMSQEMMSLYHEVRLKSQILEYLKSLLPEHQGETTEILEVE